MGLYGTTYGTSLSKNKNFALQLSLTNIYSNNWGCCEKLRKSKCHFILPGNSNVVKRKAAAQPQTTELLLASEGWMKAKTNSPPLLSHGSTTAQNHMNDPPQQVMCGMCARCSPEECHLAAPSRHISHPYSRLIWIVSGEIIWCLSLSSTFSQGNLGYFEARCVLLLKVYCDILA